MHDGGPCVYRRAASALRGLGVVLGENAQGCHTPIAESLLGCSSIAGQFDVIRVVQLAEQANGLQGGDRVRTAIVGAILPVQFAQEHAVDRIDGVTVSAVSWLMPDSFK